MCLVWVCSSILPASTTEKGQTTGPHFQTCPPGWVRYTATQGAARAGYTGLHIISYFCLFVEAVSLPRAHSYSPASACGQLGAGSMWELVGLPERHQKCPNSELLPSPRQEPRLAGALSHLELTAAPMGTMFTKYPVSVAMESVVKTGPQEPGSVAMPADAGAEVICHLAVPPRAVPGPLWALAFSLKCKTPQNAGFQPAPFQMNMRLSFYSFFSYLRQSFTV